MPNYTDFDLDIQNNKEIDNRNTHEFMGSFKLSCSCSTTIISSSSQRVCCEPY